MLHRLAQQEVELGSLQLEVKQGHQDLTRKVRDTLAATQQGSRSALLQQTSRQYHICMHAYVRLMPCQTAVSDGCASSTLRFTHYSPIRVCGQAVCLHH